ncbi:MAG: GTPase Era [Candidatus Omnitrophica bacterium]|nr:GTPase Era [Candidatus Omnitrophota bacterium]
MENKDFKSGFAAIIGRPNVGKSTLINRLVAEKISIVSAVPQTTRYQIRGILNTKDAQVILVDTPGMHQFKENLAECLNSVAKQSLSGCDIVLYVVDLSREPGREEQRIVDFLVSQNLPVMMVLNKIDKTDRNLNAYISLWKEKDKEDKLMKWFLPVSAKDGTNIDKLKSLIIESLPQSHPFYDSDIVTDFPLRFRFADIVREKLFLALNKELPHSIAVEIENIEEKEKVTHINAIIYVNRISQKKIVIGLGGEVAKHVGRAARLDIEKIVGRKVFLKIWVKVVVDWQNKTRILKELGYEGF